MTDARLAKLCMLWQRRLRLLDWKIQVKFQPESGMPDDWGASDVLMDELAGSISLRDDLSDALAERTLVHELLHFRLLPFSLGEESEPNHDAREQAINLLADCYLAAYKSRRPKLAPGREIPA